MRSSALGLDCHRHGGRCRERLLCRAVDERVVGGVADAGPDRDGMSGDGVDERRVVEHGEGECVAAASGDDDQVGVGDRSDGGGDVVGVAPNTAGLCAMGVSLVTAEIWL